MTTVHAVIGTVHADALRAGMQVWRPNVGPVEVVSASPAPKLGCVPGVRLTVRTESGITDSGIVDADRLVDVLAY